MSIRIPILGGLLLSAAAWTVASRAPIRTDADINYSEMTRDLDALRIVVNKVLRDKATETATSGSNELILASYLFSASAEAYYVAGSGVVVLARTDVPLVGPPSGETEAKDAKEPSLWEQAQAELDGRPSGARTAREWGFDPAAVENIKDRVLEGLAAAGSHIRQLADTERISIIVRSSNDTFRTWRSRRAIEEKEKGVAAEVARPGDTTLAIPGTRSGDYFWSTGGKTVLSVSVLRGDCGAVADGKISKDDFRKRAKFAQYFHATSEGGASAVRTFSTR